MAARRGPGRATNAPGVCGLGHLGDELRREAVGAAGLGGRLGLLVLVREERVPGDVDEVDREQAVLQRDELGGERGRRAAAKKLAGRGVGQWQDGGERAAPGVKGRKG